MYSRSGKTPRWMTAVIVIVIISLVGVSTVVIAILATSGT